MGADLYITSISDKLIEKNRPLFEKFVQKRDKETNAKLKAKYQEEVHKYYNRMYARGYFRDSYNATCLFWTLNLSWWEDIPVDKNGFLQVEDCKKLLETVKARKITAVKEFAKHLEVHGAVVDNESNSPAIWRKYFTNKKRQLIRFLQTAINMNSPIRCSL
jgi:hypothetical protein